MHTFQTAQNDMSVYLLVKRKTSDLTDFSALFAPRTTFVSPTSTCLSIIRISLSRSYIRFILEILYEQRKLRCKNAGKEDSVAVSQARAAMKTCFHE